MINKAKTSFWDERRGVIHAKNGGWVIGEGIFSYGYSMMDDLVGTVTYFQTVILNIKGYLPEKKLADWLEAAYICMSWPDSRLWCNQIGAMGGTLRTSPAAAICAGILASDSRMYGPGTLPDAVRFIESAIKKKQEGATVMDIISVQAKRKKSKPVLPGFGRPIAYGDERVAAMERVTKNLGFKIMDHLLLAYNIQDALFSEYGESMNLGGYVAAFLKDHGFSLEDINRLTAITVNSGVNACYSEAFDNIPESFLPLRCDDIDYQGKPLRHVPKK